MTLKYFKKLLMCVTDLALVVYVAAGLSDR